MKIAMPKKLCVFDYFSPAARGSEFAPRPRKKGWNLAASIGNRDSSVLMNAWRVSKWVPEKTQIVSVQARRHIC